MLFAELTLAIMAKSSDERIMTFRDFLVNPTTYEIKRLFCLLMYKLTR